MKAYILSNYDEHGAEDVHVTTNKDHVIDMAKKHFPDFLVAEELDRLNYLLETNDVIQVKGMDLGRGWGGLQLHIVEIE